MPLTEEAVNKCRKYIAFWNLRNPIDYQWRKHFEIPFGSEKHFEADFIEQMMWFQEYKMYEEINENPHASIDSEGRVINYVDPEGWGMTQGDIDDAFESMSVTELNQKYGIPKKEEEEKKE